MNSRTHIDSLQILKACHTERRRRDRICAFKILGMTCAFLFCFAFSAKATHQRAAEITYAWVGGNAYEITLTTYNVPNAAWEQRDSLPVLWGERFAGRIEAAADRKAGVLTVMHFWPEPGIRQTKKLTSALTGAVKRLAAFNGCDRTEYTASWNV